MKGNLFPPTSNLIQMKFPHPSRPCLSLPFHVQVPPINCRRYEGLPAFVGNTKVQSARCQCRLPYLGTLTPTSIDSYEYTWGFQPRLAFVPSCRSPGLRFFTVSPRRQGRKGMTPLIGYRMYVRVFVYMSYLRTSTQSLSKARYDSFRFEPSVFLPQHSTN